MGSAESRRAVLNNGGWGMRYAEYQKKVARLDRQIGDCLRREERVASGRPWYFKMAPSLAVSAIETSNRKRAVLARERARLDRETFGAASLIWNVEPTAVFLRTVPSSPEAIDQLRAAADAAYDIRS
jgi:hypothetical protein